MTLDDSTRAGAAGAADASPTIPTGPSSPRKAAPAAGGLNEPDYETMLTAHLLCFGRAVSKHFDALLAQGGTGLTGAQARVLMRLNYMGPMTQKELADHTDVAPPTLAGTLEIMERHGLVSRTRNPADRRERLVELAVRGRDKLPILFELFRALETWLTERLSPRRVAHLLDELSVLRDRLAEVLPSARDEPHSAGETMGQPADRATVKKPS